LDGAAPTPPKFGIPLKGQVLTSTAFDNRQLIASFGAAQAGGGAMKYADGRGAFLVVNGFTYFVKIIIFQYDVLNGHATAWREAPSPCCSHQL
jgi:hypothetical protein